MTRQELNERLENEQVTETQLWQLTNLYILFDLDKDDFAKIVDAVGVNKLIARESHYNRALQALDELEARERYNENKRRRDQIKADIATLNESLATLNESIAAYEERVGA